MKLLQCYDYDDEMTAIGDRYGLWTVHPESSGGYDYLAGMLLFDISHTLLML